MKRPLFSEPAMGRILAAAALCLLLAGCGTLGGYSQSVALRGDPDCRALLTEMEQRISASSVADPFGHPVAGFPYLRSTRLLASFAAQVDGDARFSPWYQRLYQLGANARRQSLDNLPPERRFDDAERQRIETCVAALAEQDLQRDGVRQQLQQGSQVADAYNGWLRTLGLFPLTRQVVLYQVNLWQQRWGTRFNDPEWLGGEARLYHPPKAGIRGAAEVAGRLQRAAADHPLGWPTLSAEQLQALFGHHAPAWRIRHRSEADQIGRPRWQGDELRVDTEDPITYLLPSLTRFNGRTLLQLNYMVWFPERPAQGRFDIYAGHLDGLIWRVTLNPDGSVLLYDTIHPCGCYHLLFPADSRLQPRRLSPQTEQPLILSDAIPPGRGPLLLQVTAGDHYLLGIGRWQGGGTPYRTEEYQRLRGLPYGEGSRNLFAADGLVPASARPERFLLWPMGVASAGATRVWGTHAVSFASKRHFDDPYLLESLFEWVE